MKRTMKKEIAIAVGLSALLLLSGCQSGSGDAETEALKKQIGQLEQQIADLQQSGTEVSDTAISQTPAADASQQAAGQTTTYTLEELTSMVEAYVEKADAAASGDLEAFFSLKQEEKQLDDLLDSHEYELEDLYRQNALTQDEYRSQEQELEKLEDSLDGAEDRLERTFGIDD